MRTQCEATTYEGDVGWHRCICGLVGVLMVFSFALDAWRSHRRETRGVRGLSRDTDHPVFQRGRFWTATPTAESTLKSLPVFGAEISFCGLAHVARVRGEVLGFYVIFESRGTV